MNRSKTMKGIYDNLSKLQCPLLISAAVVLITLLCIMCVGCKERKPEGREVNNNYWYIIAKIDSHDYIISGATGRDGVGLTHSESCSCKKGIK